MKAFIKLLILLIGLFFIHNSSIAQGPPNPPGDPSTGGVGPVGGTAPVGSGLGIMLALSIGFGAKKTYNYLVRNKEDSEELNS